MQLEDVLRAFDRITANVAKLEAVREIERLLGDTIERRGRWSDLHRHLRFGRGKDSLWEPPAIRPFIEMWPNSRLETLLSRRPDLVETHHLRG